MKTASLGKSGYACMAFHDFADNIKFALKVRAVFDGGTAADKYLVDGRFCRTGEAAQNFGPHRYPAPAEQGLALCFDNRRAHLHQRLALVRIPG